MFFSVFRKFIDIFRLKKYIESREKLLKEIRTKELITVVFVIHEVAMWKTENLYLAMLKHPRFNPIICPAITNEDLPKSAFKKYNALISYLIEKGYPYKEVRFIRDLHPDITFYGKTYNDIYSNTLWIDANPGLIMHQQYGFMNTNMHSLFNHDLLNYASQFFVENEIMVKTISPHLKTKGNNLVITGTTVMDELLKPMTNYDNPWRNVDTKKKKIIWAPHFSIKDGTSWVNFSSFCEICDDMISFAKKYVDKVDFAFKPHPLLYSTLIQEWGVEKTDNYYQIWRDMPNTQYVDDGYMGLFSNSDALIHDCGSFMMEYLYMHKPVCYTLVRSNKLTGLNEFAQSALDVHIHAYTPQMIEDFIIDVIKGKDRLKKERENFFISSLLPPHGKSACTNIINSILGIEEYSA